MALDTYTGLLAATADTLARSDLTAVIPTWVSLAEAQANRRLRVRKMVERSVATVSSETFALPTDFLEERTLTITVNGVTCDMEWISPEAMDDLRPCTSSPPAYWTVLGSEIRILPVPTQSYTLTLTYFQRIPALSDANPTNWLLADYPDAYLYGTLLQSAPYLIDDSRAGTWASFFTTALDDIQSAGRDVKRRFIRADGGLRARRRTFDINSGC